MGYQVPVDADGASRYGMRLRIASGVPVQPGLGTSFANMRTAIDNLLPGSPIVFGALSNVDLINLLPRAVGRNRRRAVMTVISRMEELPKTLRRHVGVNWNGLHAITLAGQKLDPATGRQQVYWMDPMGKIAKGYAGEWVDWLSVVNTLHRSDQGDVRVIYGVKRSAV
jgi:hypothetical protein